MSETIATQVAAWETMLGTKIYSGALIYQQALPDLKALAQRISDHLLTLSRLDYRSGTDLQFLAQDWWDWTPGDATVTDPFKHELLRSGAESQKLAVYRGKFAARLAKALYVRLGIDLSDTAIDQCAQMVASSNNAGGGYYFDFTRLTDWRDGDFGDKGSCLWNGRESARRIMEYDPDFYALRFYAPPGADERGYGSGQGLGRTWLITRPLTYEYEGFDKRVPVRTPILWNGYWHAGGNDRLSHDYGQFQSNCTRMAAQVMAQYLGSRIKEIRLSNSPAETKMVYINNGRGQALIPRFVLPLSDMGCDMLLVAPGMNDLIVCTQCQTVHKRRTMHYPPDADTHAWCEACYQANYVTCYHCTRVVHRLNGELIDGHRLCSGCVTAYVYTCSACQARLENYHISAYRADDSDALYCETCFNAQARTCSACARRYIRLDNTPVYTLKSYLAWYRKAYAPLPTEHLCTQCLTRYNSAPRICHVCGRPHTRAISLITGFHEATCAICYEQARALAGQARSNLTVNACVQCGALVVPDATVMYAEHTYCPACAEDHIPNYHHTQLPLPAAAPESEVAA